MTFRLNEHVPVVELDIVVVKGDPFQFPVAIKKWNPATSAYDVVDLTDAVVTAAIYAADNDETAAWSGTLTTILAAAGTSLLAVTADESDQLTAVQDPEVPTMHLVDLLVNESGLEPWHTELLSFPVRRGLAVAP